MATIKAIDGRSVHQIQSGQVIVDLCSVVKELVENSLDAGATSIDVRFKGSGLDAIEVQDNGGGIAPEDFETIALKHYTSKLSTFADIGSLQTFGFRGEALSSLCALSTFRITTARAVDAPRGSRLDFESSGKLKDTSIIASQKGTTVTVECIFRNLPVRRKELEKNVKREYGKALSLLQAYACISTGVRLSVSNQPIKGNKAIAFSTKANPLTAENISNVYGAKTTAALLDLNLVLELQPSEEMRPVGLQVHHPTSESESRVIHIEGHISRPVFGEGRQTPDRQMFFVNSRPCTLPQVSKTFNEVYRSYNVTQSPFIFANIILDTNAYDVNVSPDKKTILLHNQHLLLESLKTSLAALFDDHDQSVPQASAPNKRLTAFGKPSSSSPSIAMALDNADRDDGDAWSSEEGSVGPRTGASAARAFPNLVKSFAGRNVHDRDKLPAAPDQTTRFSTHDGTSRIVADFNNRMARQVPAMTRSSKHNPDDEEYSVISQEDIASIKLSSQKDDPGVVPNAFDRMRPKRPTAETVTVTVGDETTEVTIGTPAKRQKIHEAQDQSPAPAVVRGNKLFGRTLQAFAAPGTQLLEDEEQSEEDQADSDVPPTPIPPDSSSQNDPGDVSTPPVENVAEEDESMDGDLPPSTPTEEFSDDEYIDEDEKKKREEVRVARLIEEAERNAAVPSQDNLKRAASALRNRARKDSTLQLVHVLGSTVGWVEEGLNRLTAALKQHEAMQASQPPTSEGEQPLTKTAEDRLSLTVSKPDFARMRVVGQFNLGFILAVRPVSSESAHGADELFIIDQHAADEKYNFERLAENTVVQHQRLVHPKPLELTAVEEEIVMEHPDILAQNGFQLESDTSGAAPVGRRCKLISLPMSKEVTFNIRDLEELIVLLGGSSIDDAAQASAESAVRPSKVRKMLAMRACRSSIMVGRNLTGAQMTRVVRHMGEMDKPWNCPHGRPTMRHLFALDNWKTGWKEGMGLTGMGEQQEISTNWKQYSISQEV